VIGVKLHGRLGNQLFQYAFAYATAKKLNTTFYLDKRLSPDLISQYFLVSKDRFQWIDRSIFSFRFHKNFFSSYLRLGFYSKIKALLNLEDIEFSNNIEPEKELLNIKNHKLYSGYFQSENYFKDYKTVIFNQFKLKNNFIRSFNSIFSTLPQGFQKVVVHVRRTDYIDHQIDLPLAYFHHAIEQVNDPENFYIIISDDPKFIAQEFGYLKYKYISNHNEIIDFQFLMHADICILSNSSFSWWGAYLNQNKKRVIAPKYWLGHQNKIEEPSHVLIKGWETLAV